MFIKKFSSFFQVSATQCSYTMLREHRILVKLKRLSRFLHILSYFISNDLSVSNLFTIVSSLKKIRLLLTKRLSQMKTVRL